MGPVAFAGQATTMTIATPAASAVTDLGPTADKCSQIAFVNLGITPVFFVTGVDTTIVATVAVGTPGNTTSNCIPGSQIAGTGARVIFTKPREHRYLATIFNTGGATATLIVSIGEGSL